MSSPGYLGLVIVLCLLALFYLRLKCLYLLFVYGFVQNTALPFLYTSFGASRTLVASLLLFKEILLLAVFVYCIFLWHRDIQQPWPKPVYILLLFTSYCVLRVGIAFFLGDDPWVSFWKLRLVCLPLQFLVIAITVARTEPEFARRFLKQMTYLLVFLAFVAILMFLLPPNDFWLSNANMADYGLEIRGDDPSMYVESTGTTATATGRDAFTFLAAFRAFGTFGDPLAMGFALCVPFLLLAFIYRKRWFTIPLLAILAAAIFATFDRSVWIFLFVVGLIILFRRREYKWLIGFACVPVVLLLTYPPLAEFARSEYELLSWTNPGTEHAEGITQFYQRAFADPGNILGKGMNENVRKFPESGYAFLLEHFGLVAYLTWMWFLFSMYRHLALTRSGRGDLLLPKAMILGTLVVMHFSHYPFNYVGWIPIWYVFGLSVAGPGSAVSMVRTPQESLAVPAQKLLPESGNAQA
jgi:hypothetical protein